MHACVVIDCQQVLKGIKRDKCTHLPLPPALPVEPDAVLALARALASPLALPPLPSSPALPRFAPCAIADAAPPAPPPLAPPAFAAETILYHIKII